MSHSTTAQPDFDYSLHYLNWHNESPEHIRQMVSFHKDQLRTLLPRAKDAAILDIGCGMGFALQAVRDLGLQNVVGIDSDPAQVRSCQSRRLDVRLVSDSVAFLAQHAASYDAILMLDVLEHIPVDSQIAFARTVCRALKPNGKIILTVPNANSILAARWRYLDFTHACSFTEHSLRFVLQNAGFSNIEFHGDEELRRPPLRLWKASSRVWFRKWLVRAVWRQVFLAEIEDGSDVGRIPISMNLFAVATKANANARAVAAESEVRD